MLLGKLILSYRKEQGLGVRKMAKIIGVDHSCLFRFENGQDIESDSLIKIWNWVMFGPASALGK